MDDTSGGLLSGNVFDYGVEGAHNFGVAPWLTFYGKLAFQSSISVNHLNIRQTYPVTGEDFNVYPKFITNGVGGISFGFNYIEAGLKFSPVFNVVPDVLSIKLNSYVGVRHSLLLRAEVGGTFELPFGIFVKPYGGIDAYPYRNGNRWLTPPDENGDNGKPAIDKSGTNISDLYGGLQVGVSFAWLDINYLNNLSILLDASWRTHGKGTGDRTGSSIWLIDSGDALKYNGFARFNFTVDYAATQRLRTYLQVRYEIKNVQPLPQGTARRMDRPEHDVYLRAGVSYRFDGTK